MQHLSLSSRAGAAVLLLLAGCVSEEQSTKSFELERPRTSGGTILRDSPSDWAERWSKMLEEQERMNRAKEAGRATPPVPGTREEPAAAERAVSGWPEGTGLVVDLPRLSPAELRELLRALRRVLETRHGYRPATGDAASRGPAPPAEAVGGPLLAREDGGQTRLLCVGYWKYRSRLPQLVVHAATLNGDLLAKSPDAELVEAELRKVLASMTEAREGLTTNELESRVVQLSYVDVKGALSAMKGLGFSTFEAGAAVPPNSEFAQLPLIVELPAPAPDATGLVAAKSQIGQGQFGSTVIPTIPSDMSSEVIASPTSRLMVLFHPAHPEQFSRVKQLLGEVIDRPARQIFLEGLVLEVSTADIKTLGVQWEGQDNHWDIVLGTLVPETIDDGDSLSVLGSKAQDFQTDWVARIRALVADGKAEILSRPSVLTLNNRQATIRIGQDIPIATSQELTGDSNKISFDFKYLALGILLNVRPRISEDASEISMMVDTMVSSQVPEGDLELRDADGAVVASAPSVDSRRVQTYARIQNNTPFIIGGLVSRNDIYIEERVPILGDIPLLGMLFRSTHRRDVKREVIIVLTPYIVPENVFLSRALPKEGLVDAKDNELFRDSRRVAMDDIVDVSFLYRNQTFSVYRDLARKAIRENFRLGESPPFSLFAGRRLPGERVLVEKILYNLLARIKGEEQIGRDRIVVATAKRTGGYDIAFLEDILAQRGVGEDYRSFFSEHPDRAIALTFRDPAAAEESEQLAADPVPAMEIVDCPDREAWGRLMWEMNQPVEDGRTRNTIILHREEDLVRLRLAVLLKQTLILNGAGLRVSVFDFIPGRTVEIPELKPTEPQFLDARIARLFFHTTHFYAATIQRIEAALVELDRELRKPENSDLLEGVQLPEPKAERK